MNYQEALNVFGLSGEITEEIIKKTKKVLALKYHPDRNPAGNEMMQIINAAYDFLIANFAKFSTYQASPDQAYDYSEVVNNALNELMKMNGLILEILGNWVWISGETKANKDALKALGCFYAAKKQMWYFRPEEHRCTGNRRNHSMDEIREKFGSSGQMKATGKQQLKAA